MGIFALGGFKPHFDAFVERLVTNLVVAELCIFEACITSLPTLIPDGYTRSPIRRGCGKYEAVWVLMALADHKAYWKASGLRS